MYYKEIYHITYYKYSFRGMHGANALKVESRLPSSNEVS